MMLDRTGQPTAANHESHNDAGSGWESGFSVTLFVKKSLAQLKRERNIIALERLSHLSCY